MQDLAHRGFDFVSVVASHLLHDPLSPCVGPVARPVGTVSRVIGFSFFVRGVALCDPSTHLALDSVDSPHGIGARLASAPTARLRRRTPPTVRWVLNGRICPPWGWLIARLETWRSVLLAGGAKIFCKTAIRGRGLRRGSRGRGNAHAIAALRSTELLAWGTKGLHGQGDGEGLVSPPTGALYSICGVTPGICGLDACDLRRR